MMPDFELMDTDEDKILKEVWSKEDIETKTELDSAQIMRINKLYSMSFILGSSFLKTHIENFLHLQKSKGRKSMEEFVNVVKAKREDFVNKGKSFFQNILG